MTKLKVTLLGFGLLMALGALGMVLLLPRPAQAQGQTATPLMTATCNCQESSFGDLAADALRAAGNADIGLVGAISFNTGTMAPGPVTEDRVAALLANPNERWAVSRLTGAQIRGALEHAVRTAPLPNNSFLQVGGLSFDYSQSAPRDERVRAVRVGFGTLSDQATYTVAMPLSLAKGGSGFFKFFPKEAIITTGDTGLVAAIVNYAGRQGTVSYTGVGRINVVP